VSSKLKRKLERYVPTYRLENSDDETIVNYLEDYQNKDPKVGIQYIGLEIECYGKMNRISLQKLFFNNDLEKYVMIGRDPTIRPDTIPGEAVYWNTYELRLLIPQKELTRVLKKFDRVFKVARLKTNETCGLHVHLDMRRRNEDECFAKLLKFQDALYALVNKDRWNNTYCRQTDEDDRDHHMGINMEAYDEHETIEVRIHHGTTDTRAIEQWVRLLLNVIDAKNVPQVTNKRSVLRWTGLNKRLRTYVKRNFKDVWFREKDRFVL